MDRLGADSPATPAWQRAVLRVLFPLLARMIRLSVKIGDTGYERVVARIENTLGDADAALTDGRKSLLDAFRRAVYYVESLYESR